MSETPPKISEDEAARLWKRAAELQAEAARREEAAPQPVEPDTAEVLPDTSGYALDHVRAAAVEAGISGEFVDAALTELSSRSTLPAPPTGAADDLARRFLDDPPDVIEVSRVIEAPVARVLESMERIFPGEPYGLSLRDRQGVMGEGGVLVFDITGASFTPKPGWAADASMADMRQLHVSLRRISGDSEATEVTIRSPIAWARGMNFWMGVATTGIGGAIGLGLGSAAGAGISALIGAMSLPVLAAIVATLVVVLGVVSGGGMTVHGFRLLFDWGVGKGEKAIRTLLSALAVDAQGGWGIAPLTGSATDRPMLPSNSTSSDESSDRTAARPDEAPPTSIW